MNTPSLAAPTRTGLASLDHASGRRASSLRRLLVSWVIGTALIFALLVAGLVVTLRRQNALALDQGAITHHDQLALSFELEALAANVSPPPSPWQRADAALLAFRRNEPDITPRLVNAYQALKASYNASNPRSDEAPFLDALREYRAHKAREMAEDQRNSERLNAMAQMWALGLAALALGVLTLESRVLWQRLFKPTLALTEAAQQIEAGDLSTRVEVQHADELGELARTFNAMTQAMQAREAERLHFVATVAHDLKNPLTVVGGIALLLSNKPDKFTSEEQQEWLTRIGANARRMEDMVADLTDGVQAQTGALVIHSAPFDFSQMAQGALQDAQQIYPDHPFHASIAEGLTYQGDRARLERVLTNLLSNAAKYSPKGKPVHLEVGASTTGLTISVRDEGYGIAPDDLPRLFRPFSRLERTATKAPGTGLGLATVQKIIEAHGGHIEVSSQLDQGTTFRVSLPSERQEDAQSSVVLLSGTS